MLKIWNSKKVWGSVSDWRKLKEQRNAVYDSEAEPFAIWKGVLGQLGELEWIADVESDVLGQRLFSGFDSHAVVK